MTVIVKKLGGSMVVVIPMAVARELKLTEGMPLYISTTADGIMLRKQRRRARRPISALIAQIKPGGYRRRSRELSGDRPVGQEIWRASELTIRIGEI